jgi:molecular chaperone Hsp33
LAVGQIQTDGALSWRAGGMVLQNVAEDDARAPTQDAWERSQALFETVGEDELIDPTVSPERLLFRLFHEDGVRMFEPKALSAMCRCSQDRIVSVLRSFSDDEREGMVEDDGVIRVTCEYCSRIYDVAPETVASA